MQGIATKVAVEIEMALKQSNMETLTGKEQGQHGSGWSTADNTAGCFVDGLDVVSLRGSHKTTVAKEDLQL